jgi:chromosome partitioning protein
MMQGREALQLQLSAETETLIIDLPAALNSADLQDVTYNAGSILNPVLPSAIDINCASRFIAELLLLAQIDRRNQQLAVVANRTRQNTKSYRMLARFLTSLSIPLIAVLRDSQNYVHAAGRGIGIGEMPRYLIHKDIEQFERIIDWLDRWRERKREAARSLQFECLSGAKAPTPANHHHRH